MAPLGVGLWQGLLQQRRFASRLALPFWPRCLASSPSKHLKHKVKPGQAATRSCSLRPHSSGSPEGQKKGLVGHAEGPIRFSCPSSGLRVDAGRDGGVESGGTEGAQQRGRKINIKQ